MAIRTTRVAMFGSLPPLRGISSYCLELARSVSRRVPVEFVTFKSMYPAFLYPGGDPGDDETFPALERGLTVRRSLTWYNPAGWMAEGLGLRADVAHAQYWSLPLAPIYLVVLALLKLRGAKVVLTLHNVHPHERSRLHGWATRALCLLADRCIVHSEANYRQALRDLHLPQRKLRRIDHGVLSFFNDGPAALSLRGDARRALGLPAEAAILLCFGAIRPYKGIDVLLRAFAKVLAELPAAALVIAGKPWGDWTPHQALMARLGIASRVHTFLRYIPAASVKLYFHAADLCVLPYTRFDAQSGAGLTGLAFHKPMIVTDVGGLPELVSDRRFVAPPNDPDALAERILLCLRDPRQLARMRDDAARLAGAFSWDRIAAETVGLYESVCAPGRREASPHGVAF